MKIDLSSVDLFEENELELKKQTNIIYGKNGTGKSTLTRAFKKMSSEYEVFVFDGFNNIIEKNHRLNAVVLGKENASISREIGEKEKELENIKSEIDKIRITLQEPEQGETNFWTRLENAKVMYNNAEKQLEDFYTVAASC